MNHMYQVYQIYQIYEIYQIYHRMFRERGTLWGPGVDVSSEGQ